MRSVCFALVCVLLAACQPRQQDFAPSSVAPKLFADAVRVGDGAHLPLTQWIPESGEPSAILLALHGFNDYSHAFAYAGRYFSTRGVGLIAYDQRGFGANDPQGVWAGSDNLIRDLLDVKDAVTSAYPTVPLYVLGESMGGAVLINACAEDGCEDVAGLILASPALWGEDTLSSVYHSALWIAAHVAPTAELTGEELDIMASDNLRVLYEMGSDPLVVKETRIDAVYGLVDLMDAAKENVVSLNRPILLLYGGKDQIIAPLPIARAINRIRCSLSVGYYSLGYHMLLRDYQREVVMYDMLRWIGDRYAPLPSASDMGWKEELLGIE